ncbi:MAG: hypothetical protein ACRCYU_10615 [Nocardioides sp.]
MLTISRRNLIRSGSLATISTPLALNRLATPATAATGQFPAHVPGKIYLGVSGVGFDITNRTGAVGLRRTFHRWDGMKREMRLIHADHRANRLPWTSFRPPAGPIGTAWKRIGDGAYDADIRRRAESYAELSRPVIVTFCHEPQRETAPPAEYARAWVRIHDVMKSATGLKNVIHAPILGEWTWNPRNRRHNPADWMTPAVLDRCDFMGIDLYQTALGETYEQRVARVLAWLDERGRTSKMIGIGETACSDDFETIKGAPWWRASWQYAVARADRVVAVSYFNNLLFNNQGYNWLLTQSPAKLEAFTESVRSPATIKLTSAVS